MRALRTPQLLCSEMQLPTHHGHFTHAPWALHPRCVGTQVFVRLRPPTVKGVAPIEGLTEEAIKATSDVELTLEPPQNAKRCVYARAHAHPHPRCTHLAQACPCHAMRCSCGAAGCSSHCPLRSTPSRVCSTGPRHSRPTSRPRQSQWCAAVECAGSTQAARELTRPRSSAALLRPGACTHRSRTCWRSGSGTASSWPMAAAALARRTPLRCGAVRSRSAAAFPAQGSYLLGSAAAACSVSHAALPVHGCTRFPAQGPHDDPGLLPQSISAIFQVGHIAYRIAVAFTAVHAHTTSPLAQSLGSTLRPAPPTPLPLRYRALSSSLASTAS